MGVFLCIHVDMAQHWPIQYLYLGKDWDNGNDDAEDQVEADEDLVLCAVIWLSVVNVEKHHSSDSQGVVQDSEGQQACNLHNHMLNVIA